MAQHQLYLGVAGLALAVTYAGPAAAQYYPIQSERPSVEINLDALEENAAPAAPPLWRPTDSMATEAERQPQEPPIVLRQPLAPPPQKAEAAVPAPEKIVTPPADAPMPQRLVKPAAKAAPAFAAPAVKTAPVFKPAETMPSAAAKAAATIPKAAPPQAIPKEAAVPAAAAPQPKNERTAGGMPVATDAAPKPVQAPKSIPAPAEPAGVKKPVQAPTAISSAAPATTEPPRLAKPLQGAAKPAPAQHQRETVTSDPVPAIPLTTDVAAPAVKKAPDAPIQIAPETAAAKQAPPPAARPEPAPVTIKKQPPAPKSILAKPLFAAPVLPPSTAAEPAPAPATAEGAKSPPVAAGISASAADSAVKSEAPARAETIAATAAPTQTQQAPTAAVQHAAAPVALPARKPAVAANPAQETQPATQAAKAAAEAPDKPAPTAAVSTEKPAPAVPAHTPAPPVATTALPARKPPMQELPATVLSGHELDDIPSDLDHIPAQPQHSAKAAPAESSTEKALSTAPSGSTIKNTDDEEPAHAAAAAVPVMLPVHKPKPNVQPLSAPELATIGKNIEAVPAKVAEAPPQPKQPAKRLAVPSAADLTLEFEGSSSELAPETQEKLSGIVGLLTENDARRLAVNAYASGEDGSRSSARRISLSRALSVRSFLMDKGVKPTRVDVRALGLETDRKPLDRVDLVFAK